MSIKALWRGLFISEREVLLDPLSFVRGRKKFKAWLNLAGFRLNQANLKSRLDLIHVGRWRFQMLLGNQTVLPSGSADTQWLTHCLKLNEQFKYSIRIRKLPSLTEYLDRGLINPFLPLIQDAITKLKDESHFSFRDVDLLLSAKLGSLEQMSRRAVILKLHVDTAFDERNESDKFRTFVDKFEKSEARLKFYVAYPVLLRIIHGSLDSWCTATREFLSRLQNDRLLIQEHFGISAGICLKKVVSAGDTHNNGRSVLILTFDDDSSLVYKPRSVNLEAAFQNYLNWANEKNPGLNLYKTKVVSCSNYGWVEFINHGSCKDEASAKEFYFRLGFLTTLVYSLNGVDIFFENLVASGDQPVIVDLETMFHTSLEELKPAGPRVKLQNWLFRSIAGIGILPQPGVAASDNEVFDVSVMGAKINARAPYKVTGIENFGNANMRITEIDGWIPESNSSSENFLSRDEKGNAVLDGIRQGFNTILEFRGELIGEDGLICRCFSGAERRLIVRDTKTYGTLQMDESHPDFLRDQIDREWHWDNLWSDTIERPFLSLFIESELIQLKQGDIPYFSGPVREAYVKGGDGNVIELGCGLLSDTPLEMVLQKLASLTMQDIDEQLRVAATQLGLAKVGGLTQPNLGDCSNPFEMASLIARFLDERIAKVGCQGWCYTAFNPVPKSNEDPVTTIPIDPFLYDGLSGIALYFGDLGQVTRNEYWIKRSLDLFRAILDEINFQPQSVTSGYVGLASVLYAINYCLEINHEFAHFDPELKILSAQVLESAKNENNIDLLIGLAGTALAVLPFAKRTNDSSANHTIELAYQKLIGWAESKFVEHDPDAGLEYWRGLSHGLSGIALAIYRLGEYLNREESTDVAAKLLIREFALVQQGGWTDRHQYNGKPLVGWCHGAAGIAVALSNMPKITNKNPVITDYFGCAVGETLKDGFFDSHCLCHGSIGNLMCLQACGLDESKLAELSERIFQNIQSKGFMSFGRAQTMSIGLMTGLAGVGYLSISNSELKRDLNFLTLR